MTLPASHIRRLGRVVPLQFSLANILYTASHQWKWRRWNDKVVVVVVMKIIKSCTRTFFDDGHGLGFAVAKSSSSFHYTDAIRVGGKVIMMMIIIIIVISSSVTQLFVFYDQTTITSQPVSTCYCHRLLQQVSTPSTARHSTVHTTQYSFRLER